MVDGSRIEGGTQILSSGVRNTIVSIKRIVGDHSDTEIYATLKETDMDANEAVQKLLNQDPFHEVRRKRDKKKENGGYKVLTDPRKPREYASQGKRLNASDHGARRGGHSLNTATEGSWEFRVVRDNRVNQNTTREIKPPLLQCSPLTSDQVNSNVSEKGSNGISNNQKSGGHYSSRGMAIPTVPRPRQTQEANSSGTAEKELRENRRQVPTAIVQAQGSKPNDSEAEPATLGSSGSAEGVYSSSSDPIHVPSPDSRSAATIGAIKRDIGLVGVRRQSAENSVKLSSGQSGSFSNLHAGKDVPTSGKSFRSFSATSKNEQPSRVPVDDSVVPSMSASKSFLRNHYNNSRPHQQIMGHKKASQPNKEWQRKSSLNGHGVIGTPTESVQHFTGSTKALETDTAQVQDKSSRVNNHGNQHVVIAEYIRVTESDRCRLTFGSFGTEFDSSRELGLEYHSVASAENASAEPFTSLPSFALESSNDETSASKPDLLDDQLRSSGSNSPASGSAAENQLPDKKEPPCSQHSDSYVDVGLVPDNIRYYSPSHSQQQQDAPELRSFSVYDPQTVNDIPYFRQITDETIRGHGLPSPQEALISHAPNSIPPSTIAMVQQQQPVPQMYSQVQVSHFANLMPFRQFVSPVYVPQMPVPGYSSNATYPHLSNGSNYPLMPGGSPHLGANSLKYGIQQFKTVPAGSPAGFGNFTSPTGYTMNAPGVVGSAAVIEDSSRLKYKDGNLYVPNPQAGTSEIWMQDPREFPGMQSASYYNMAGQTPHAAYTTSHNAHASFNAAAAAAAGVPQSSHMQFPGMYHPQHQAAIANAHHLGPAMGANAGVGVAAASPGTQMGAYQHPQQLGHLNWTTNF